MDESNPTCKIQQPALAAWLGLKANVKAALQALVHRADCNRAARRGEYIAAMETSSTSLPVFAKMAA